ncbi:Spermatogenesis-associated protein 7 [Frankliniella fusca]|uniref:Spermatogenesis-associated protein 7 n=1 Tax=Frankliniella fusca TaxID=407009 RepID=A0AAE1LQR5_9NEOP|nr:Spermatogenesis-associated protein 7 [Frankliniella fusca]
MSFNHNKVPKEAFQYILSQCNKPNVNGPRRCASACPAVLAPVPSMKNSAFAVDPCPRGLLGKQWLFMHMSSHYRRMCSAQSVVDSAPPASMRARAAAPRSARHPRPRTAVDHGSLAHATAATPRASSASSSAKPLLQLQQVPVVQQVLQRQSLRAERSAQFRHVQGPRDGKLFRTQQQAHLSQRPSRADTDPGPGTGARASLGLDGRASAASSASASRRQFEYNASVLRKPPSLARHRRRDVEKQGTYYDKLNQLVPDHMSQKSGLRTSGQILSEVFTPRVPYKPQVLRTDVPSRLRFSSTYCPPRSKSNRTKTGVAGQHVDKDTEQPVWLQAQTSPPVSSRDSAYNGGISSGGESRGPTPEHKGTKKQAKKAERKSKRLADHKQTITSDAKPKRKFESKLMNKLLEEERNEIQEQRLRVVDPWHGVSQDDHGDEILRNIQNLHIESNEEYSSIEQGNPSNNGSASDQSIEEDMMEEANGSDEVETNKDDDVDDSVIRDSDSASTKSEKTPSPKRSLPAPEKEEASTQTNFEFDQSLKRIRPQISTLSHSGTSSSVSEKHLNLQQSSHSTSRQLAVNTPDVTFQVSGVDIKEMLTTDTTQENSGNREEGQGSLKIRQSILDKERCQCVNDTAFYNKLIHDITEALVKHGITSDKGVKDMCDEHIQANCDILDKGQMMEVVKKFQSQLGVAQENTLVEETTASSALRIETLEADIHISSDVKNCTPLISSPSKIWGHFVQQHKSSNANNSKILDGPSRLSKLGLGFGKQFDERIALSHEHIIAVDDELTEQKVCEKESHNLPVEVQGKERDSKIETKLQKVLEDSDNVWKINSRYRSLLQAGECSEVSSPSSNFTNTATINHFSYSLMTKDEKNVPSFISPTIESNQSSIPITNAEKAFSQEYQLTPLSPLVPSNDSLFNGQFVEDCSNVEDRLTHVPTKEIGHLGENCRCVIRDKNPEDELDLTPERKETPEIVFIFSGKNAPGINTIKPDSEIPTDRQEIVETEKIPSPDFNTPAIEEKSDLENTHSPQSQDSELLVGTGVNSDIIHHLNSLKTPLKVPM